MSIKIYLKSTDEIDKLREVNLIVAAVLDAVRGGVQAGRRRPGT